MIFTITYTQPPATDLGYLLHKNPSRPQTFELNHVKRIYSIPRQHQKDVLLLCFLISTLLIWLEGKRDLQEKVDCLIM